MEKRAILTAVVIVLGVVGLAQAQPGELHGTVGITYQSKYIWRGFDIYNDKSAIEPSVDLDLYGTGLGFNVTGHMANSSGTPANSTVNGERWDYTLYYHNMMFAEEDRQTNYMIGWRYYNYPDSSSSVGDLQELHAVLSWPKICPAGVVPSYCLVKLWPSESGSAVGGNASGFAHIFMLDYPLTMQAILPEAPEQVLNLHTELVYNDGVHPGGGNADQDWSNVVFGVTTDFDLGNNMTLTPGVHYQVTMDESVNTDDDELWATVGLKYAF